MTWEGGKHLLAPLGVMVTVPVPTGQKLLDSLAETWDFFFSDVLPTLQAVFYPVQVSGSWATGTADPSLGVGTPLPLLPRVGHLRPRSPPDLPEPAPHSQDGHQASSTLRALGSS